MMTSTNLEKYVYSKKCLKQRRQPTPPSSKVEIFSRRKVTWLRLLFWVDLHLFQTWVGVRQSGISWAPGYFLIATRRPRSNHKRYRFSFLLPQLFHFLVEIAVSGKSK